MNVSNSHPQNPSRPISSPTLTRHFTQLAISLSLTQHTIMETDTVLATANNAHSSIYMHLHHSTINIWLSHRTMIKDDMHPTNCHHLSHRVIYYNLLISVHLRFLPRDRFLSITLDITIHTLTSFGPDDPPTTQHNLHLFLTHIRDHPIFNTHMKVGPTPRSRYLRSALPSILACPIVYFPSSDQHDNAWCAPLPTHLIWVEQSIFLRNQHSAK